MPNDVQLSLLIQLFQRIKKVSKKKKPPSLFFFSRKYLEPVEGGVDSPIFFKVRWNNLAIINKSDSTSMRVLVRQFVRRELVSNYRVQQSQVWQRLFGMTACKISQTVANPSSTRLVSYDVAFSARHSPLASIF